MKQETKVTCLFLDIGGVMLSNGWEYEFRKIAADHFQLDFKEMEDRHELNMVTLEEGKLTLSEYLNRVVFYETRPFTPDQFRDFMFSLTTSYEDMIAYFRALKEKYKLKIAVVSNEGRELNEYRIQKFQLTQFVDFFISSCYVHFRKPDADIFRLAIDIAQVPLENVVLIDNTKMFVDIAKQMGIRSIHHKNYLATSEELASMGLSIG